MKPLYGDGPPPRSLEPVLVGFRISEVMRGNVGNGFGMVLVPAGVVCVLLRAHPPWRRQAVTNAVSRAAAASPSERSVLLGRDGEPLAAVA